MSTPLSSGTVESFSSRPTPNFTVWLIISILVCVGVYSKHSSLAENPNYIINKNCNIIIVPLCLSQVIHGFSYIISLCCSALPSVFSYKYMTIIEVRSFHHFLEGVEGEKKKRKRKERKKKKGVVCAESKASAKIWLHLICFPRLFFIKYVWLLSLIKCRINFGKLTTDAVYVQFYQTDLFISCQLLERLHFGAVLNC